MISDDQLNNLLQQMIGFYEDEHGEPFEVDRVLSFLDKLIEDKKTKFIQERIGGLNVRTARRLAGLIQARRTTSNRGASDGGIGVKANGILSDGQAGGLERDDYNGKAGAKKGRPAGSKNRPKAGQEVASNATGNVSGRDRKNY